MTIAATSCTSLARRLRTSWSVVSFLVVGIAWFVVHPPSASVGMDDGAYAIAAAQVQEGSWSVPYEAAAADPDGAAFPYPNAERGADGYYPYVRQPAWVVALAAADAIGGPIGMRLLVLAAGGAAVAVTGLLARAAGRPEAGPLAAALVALSPLAYNSLQLWAHAPAMLMTGVAAVGGCWLMGGVRSGWAASIGVAGAAGTGLLRADGALFAFAVGAVVVWVGMRGRRVHVAMGGVAIAVAAAAGQVASVVWAGSITGSADGSSVPASRADGGPFDRVQAALQTLVGQDIGSDRALLLALIALSLVAGAVVLARRGDTGAAIGVGGAAALVWLVRIVVERDELVTGLLGAWPLAAFVFLVPLDRWSAEERRLAAMFALGGAAVLLTQYGVGGGANWGGRFLSAGLPLLAVLASSALRRWTTAHDGHDSRQLLLVVAAVAGVTTVASLALDSHYRGESDAAVASIESRSPDAWVVTSSLSLPNLAWRSVDDIRWLRVPEPDAGGAGRLREVLDRLDVDEIVALRLDDDHFTELTGQPPSRNVPDEPRTWPVRP